MPGMSKKETEHLLEYIEPQGVAITPVKSGFMLRLPNGESTTVHLTGSDYRGPKNLRAFLKRNGIEWPTDINDKNLYKTTLDKGRILLDYLNHPTEIKATVLNDANKVTVNLTPSTLRKVMVYFGYIRVGNTTASKWKIPTPIVIEEPKPIVPLTDEVTVPTPTVEHREFLDTHDSWTVNVEMIPDTITLKDMRSMFAAMNMNFEIRIWK